MSKFWQLFIAIALVSVQFGCASVKEAPVDTPVVVIDEPQVDLLFEALQRIPNVVEVKSLPVTDHFIQHYELWFEQHVDPFDENSATFKQRVLLAHANENAPVIVELQGYQIWSPRSGELASLTRGNQITIEHRFFAPSVPEKEIPWKHLTIRNAAEDQHIIIQALRKAVYDDNKFVSTGISKGGQTTMIHRTFYPNDVDASVCYVAPLNFEREDPRIYDFLNSVGTKEQRQQVYDFQELCFKRKSDLLKGLEALAEEKSYEWSVSTEKALELYILEYSFAFWQWGAAEFKDIPDEEASSDSLLNHVLNVSGVSFFEEQGVDRLRPFFWAALTEMGIYGYQHEPFKEYLSEQNTYVFDFTLPKGADHPQFDPQQMRKVDDFIQNKAERMLFIYGGLDTWSATGVELSTQAQARGLKKYTWPEGHHGTRMRHFPEQEQQEMHQLLKDWLGCEIFLPQSEK